MNFPVAVIAAGNELVGIAFNQAQLDAASDVAGRHGRVDTRRLTSEEAADLLLDREEFLSNDFSVGHL